MLINIWSRETKTGIETEIIEHSQNLQKHITDRRTKYTHHRHDMGKGIMQQDKRRLNNIWLC